MSELRIRSEALSDTDWSQPFVPPAARDEHDPFGDDDDFGPLLAATGRSLSALFGLAVTARPGRPPKRDDGGKPARIAPALANLLATLRFGGDPTRPTDAAGVALARHGAAIVAALDAVTATDWPATCTLREYALEIMCVYPGGSLDGHAILVAPPRTLPPPPEPILALRHEVLGLPMRIRVELAAEMRLIGSLLPLRAGQVLSIAPPAEMPLILGHHCIGRAIVSPLPDGRQQAELVAIAIDRQGDRG